MTPSIKCYWVGAVPNLSASTRTDGLGLGLRDAGLGFRDTFLRASIVPSSLEQRSCRVCRVCGSGSPQGGSLYERWR